MLVHFLGSLDYLEIIRLPGRFAGEQGSFTRRLLCLRNEHGAEDTGQADLTLIERNKETASGVEDRAVTEGDLAHLFADVLVEMHQAVNAILHRRKRDRLAGGGDLV